MLPWTCCVPVLRLLPSLQAGASSVCLWSQAWRPFASSAATTPLTPGAPPPALVGAEAEASIWAGFRSRHVQQQPYIPWTPTKDLKKIKVYPKRMRFLLQELEKETQERAAATRSFPDFKAGDILEVRVIVPEADRKEYVYRGICIGRFNKSIRTSFRIYNVFPEVGGFVQTFPLYMPDLLEVKVVGRVRVRRSKPTYMLKDETDTHMYQKGVQLPKQR